MPTEGHKNRHARAVTIHAATKTMAPTHMPNRKRTRTLENIALRPLGIEAVIFAVFNWRVVAMEPTMASMGFKDTAFATGGGARERARGLLLASLQTLNVENHMVKVPYSFLMPTVSCFVSTSQQATALCTNNMHTFALTTDTAPHALCGVTGGTLFSQVLMTEHIALRSEVLFSAILQSTVQVQINWSPKSVSTPWEWSHAPLSCSEGFPWLWRLQPIHGVP